MNKNAKKILVVDDETDIRQTIREALELEGYTVIEASNGEVGLERLKSHSDVDLIILDQMMPKLTGDGFRRIQIGTPEICDIPVILMTAAVMDDGLFYDIRPASFLKKPIDLEVFLQKIDELLKLLS